MDGRTRISAVALLATLLASCVSASDPSPSPSAEPAYPSDTVYGRLFAQVEEDGTVPFETALRMFSTAIAPLPGVAPVEGPPPTDHERMSGTHAITWLMPYLGQLTPEQRAVVDAVLHPDPSKVTRRSDDVGAGLLATAFLGITQEDRETELLWSALGEARAFYREHLHRDLNVRYNLTITEPSDPTDRDALAVARFAPGADRLIECAITVHPFLIPYDDDVQRATMAHEMFHCFQMDRFDIDALPPWIVEGQAEWAGEASTKATSVGTGWWSEYLVSPYRSLFGRTYDAVGFYEHLSTTGTDVWTVLDGMLGAASTDRAFRAAGADDHRFLDTWASGLFREGSLPGAEWNEQGRWTTSARAAALPLEISNGQVKRSDEFLPRGVAPGTNLDTIVTSKADLLEVVSSGHARLRTGPDEWVDPATLLFCTKTGGCACPDGQAYDGPPFIETTDPVVRHGITGGLGGANVSFEGIALDGFCKAEPSDAPGSGAPGGSGPRCRTDCAGSDGDPHLRTVDGFEYDFQATGEFVLLRSPDGSIELQVRQEPYRGLRGVSINTAVAARVNGHRIGIHAASGTPEMRLDGTLLTDPGDVDLGAGAHVAFHGGADAPTIEIVLPDGSEVWVLPFRSYGINVIVAPSETLAIEGAGIIAPGADSGLGIPTLPDGTIIPEPSGREELHELLYVRFADAWRVTDETTLFDYDPGRSTADFTIEGSPPLGELRTIADLTPQERASGDVACASIADEGMRDWCIFDVAVTEDDGFARAYAATQTLLVEGPTAGPTRPVESPPAAGACGSLSDDDILEITGREAIGSDALPDDPPGTACQWVIDSGGSIRLEILTQGGRAEFDEVRQFLTDIGGEREDVPDLGDAAFVGDAGAVYAVQGDAFVILQYLGGDPSEAAELLRRVFTRL